MVLLALGPQVVIVVWLLIVTRRRPAGPPRTTFGWELRVP